MSKRYARNPGADSIAKWKAAIAASHKQQRQRRVRRRADVDVINVSRPGMVRMPAARDTGQRVRPGDRETGRPPPAGDGGT